MRLLRTLIPALLLLTVACGTESITAPVLEGDKVLYEEGEGDSGGH